MIKVPDIVKIANQNSFILISLSKLEYMLDLITRYELKLSKELLKKPVAGGLVNALRREKTFGLSTTTSGTAKNWKPFTGYFVWAEHISGAYQPIVCKDYGDGTKEKWPKLHLHNHSSYSAFAPRTTDPEIPETLPMDNDHDELVMNSNASGIPSTAQMGSFASTTSRRGLPNIPGLQNLNAKIVQPVVPAKREREEDSQEDDLTSVKDKAGYCENCKEKYKVYAEVFILISISKLKSTENTQLIQPISHYSISF